MSDNDDWSPDTAPAVQPTGRTEAQRQAGVKQDAGGHSIKKHFQFRFEDVIKVKRTASSVLPYGYATGSLVGLIGPPGTGKTRFALQEAITASKEGAHSFYMFNETVDHKFKPTIDRVARSLGVSNNRDMRNIYFWDTTKQQLSTADYNSMESIAYRIWVQNVRFWLEHECEGEPRFVIFDSFSNISRRFVPQTPIFHQYLTHGLAELFAEKSIEPVILMIYQKSLSPREANTDAVVGGYGVNHEVDTEILLKLHDVDVWGARRYGWTEGTMVHTLQIPKDRYPEGEFNESVIYLNDGRLAIGPTVASFVSKHVQSSSEAVGNQIDDGF